MENTESSDTSLAKKRADIVRQVNILGDLAKEVGRLAALRLTNSLGIKVEAQDASVEPIGLEEIRDRYSFKDVMGVAVFTKVQGELPGTGFVLIQRENALKIITGAIGARPERPVSLSAFTPQIVLKHIGETLSITFCEGLSIILKRPMLPRLSAPEVFFDTWDNTLGSMVEQLPTDEEVLYAFRLTFCSILGDDRCPGTHLYLVRRNLLSSL